MKKTLSHNFSLLTITFLASLFFISCLQDKEIEDIDINFPDPVELKSVQLIGQILLDEGSPAAGAEVEIASHIMPGSFSRITDDKGYFFFPEFTNRGEEVLIRVNHPEHFQAMYSQRILDDESPVFLQAQLIEKIKITSFLPENGTQINLDNILEIDIEPNSFESHVGEIQMSVQLVFNQDPKNYLRGVNARGFLSQSLEVVKVNPWVTVFIDFTDEFGGNPILLKDLRYKLILDHSHLLDNFKSINAYQLQLPYLNFWLESGKMEIIEGEISGTFDRSGIWTIGGRTDEFFSIKGNLLTAESLLPIEGQVKLVMEDGPFQSVNRMGANGYFEFDQVLPGNRYSLVFYNNCGEEIHSYGPISIYESTDLGELRVHDFPMTEMIIDARDCEDEIRNAAFIQLSKSDGTSYFRAIGEAPTDLAIPLCGSNRVVISLLDVSGNQITGPLEIDLSEGQQYISDPYNCFDPDLTVEAEIILFDSATGETVNAYQYSLHNPKHRLILEVNTTANDLVETFRIKGKSECLGFNIHLAIESGKISNVFSQELEFFCFDFNYEYKDSEVGHTGYPSSYDGGEFINQVNIINLKNLDNDQLYDILIEFRSSN